jgi:small subunit ribosomal protein S19
MTRSNWKGPFVDSYISSKKRKNNLKIFSRSSVIPASLIGSMVSVYNGKEFKNVRITREKVGFKFGEFSFTRKYTNKYKNLKVLKKKKK